MGRREGQVRKRGPKAWLVSVFTGRDVNGKRQYVTETVKGTKKQAEEKLRGLLEKHTRGKLARPDKRSVGEYLDWWLENVAKVRVRASTLASYTAIVETYLKPDLDSTRLDKLTPLQVQALVRGLSERGLSARTVRYASAILGGALRYAVKHRLLVWNPTDDVELPRERRRELQVPAEAGRSRLLEELQADALWPLWCVMVTTGLRPGEALGLRWTDLDLGAGVLTVQRSLSRTGGAWELTEPKTAQGRRAVHLPAETVEVLRELAGAATGRARGIRGQEPRHGAAARPRVRRRARTPARVAERPAPSLRHGPAARGDDVRDVRRGAARGQG